MRQVDRDADIDPGGQRELGPVELRVDLRELLQRKAARPRDEGQVGQRKAGLGLELSLAGGAHGFDRGEIHLDGLEHMRDRLPVLREPFAGALADRVELHDAAGQSRNRDRFRRGRRCGGNRCSRRRGWARRGEGGTDILLGNFRSA